MNLYSFQRILIAVCSGIISLQAFSQHNDQLRFTIHVNDTVQKVHNIGASGCWYTEEIGKNWPAAEKQRMAELLFSRAAGKNGQPKGIGLSAFRYNIGAGTAEQGDSSGIKDVARRVECFLSPNGAYNWSKQAGYTWMLQQAKNYGVKDLIAFVNSPPVQFNKNGLGYKLEKDFSSNLGESNYEAYAKFLTDVISHFDKNNLHFNYISPVNEPQWDWSGIFGQAKQEGTPWTNEEIYHAVTALNSSLSEQKSTTKILITEAGMLSHLYDSNAKASRQINAFWNPASPLYTGGLSNATPYVEGHGYFTEDGDEQLINTRRRLKDTITKYGPGLEYWQSEYCMLGDGYKENTKVNKRSAMDCALFLAKIIHHDFTVGNATAWHYWNAFEPGPADSNTLYYLIALNRNRLKDNNKLYSITKNLWAFGHYSLFVRPGMYRVQTRRDDDTDETGAAQQLMISAFRDVQETALVVNIINYTTEDKKAALILEGISKGKKMTLKKRFVTSAKEGDDLKPYPITDKKASNNSSDVFLPARSITSFIFSQ